MFGFLKFLWEYVNDIIEIVVTGGPGGGKSTVLSKVSQILTKLGFIVIIGEEIVTRNVYSGISPKDFDTETYQSMVISQMIHREKMYRQAAEYMAKKYNKRVVIFYDRALLDNLAYMPQEMLERILAEYDLTIPLVRERYTAVIHMVTPAIGAEEAYTTANNKAREDSIEEARELDYKTRAAWEQAPDFTIIDNSTGFEEKQDRFFDVVYRILGVPVPTETERKFLVKMPDVSIFDGAEGVTKLDIFQTYLRFENPSIERRIRKRRANGFNAYFYTEKKALPDGKYEEKERIITEKEYLSRLKEGEKSYQMTRYCFAYEAQYCELNIFADKEYEAILEIKPTADATQVNIPGWLEMIKEVTSDPMYENKNFAK